MKRVSLDLLRAGAAITVLLTHARGFSFVEYGALPAEQHTLAVQAFFLATRIAHEAVLVFFVLSGALVGGQVVRRTLAGTFSPGDYALARVTRIFMPLLPACAVAVLVQAYVIGAPASPAAVVANMTGLNGVLAPTLEADVPLWSLAYEIWFYVLGGALAVALTRRSAWAFAAAFVALAVFTVLDATMLLFWVMGALAVQLTPGDRARRWLALAGVVAALSGCGLYELASGTRSFTPVSVLPGRLPEFMVCAGVALTLPLLCSERVQKRLWRMQRPAELLSGMSYTLYLMHYPTLYALALVLPKAGAVDAHSVALYALRVVACFVVSWLFYFAFEGNTSKVRRRAKRLTA